MADKALGPQVAPASAAKQASAKGESLTALSIVRREGKWVLLEMSIAGGQVINTRQVDSAYYRDLAEEAAMKWLRRAGR